MTPIWVVPPLCRAEERHDLNRSAVMPTWRRSPEGALSGWSLAAQHELLAPRGVLADEPARRARATEPEPRSN